MRRVWVGAVALVALAALAAPAVPAPAGAGRGREISAEVASFDPHAGEPQRFTVGLLSNDHRGLAFGEVSLRFGFAGPIEAPEDEVELGERVTAEYLPIAGQDEPDRVPERSRLVPPSRSRGVYGAEVSFDEPGLWVVLVRGRDRKRRFEAQSTFEVAAAPRVLAPGSEAPATTQPLAGDPDVPPESIDSRAGDDEGEVPDPILHDVTIADALAAGRPMIVVVSTPVYCVSRFCGPITESIEELAREHRDSEIAFVHLEVWRDFEASEVNDAAASWVLPPDGSPAHEPWIFVVDRDGIIQARFDNVVTDENLADTVEELISAAEE